MPPSILRVRLVILGLIKATVYSLLRRNLRRATLLIKKRLQPRLSKVERKEKYIVYDQLVGSITIYHGL